MASRKLTDLSPAAKVLVEKFIEACDKQGIDLLVTCTWRSNEEQNELYAQGRSKPGRIVTNAKAGQSRHNGMLNGKPASTAVDVVIIENGKCIWDVKDPRWAVVGKIGESVGLEWAGRWKKFPEFPHFQTKE